MIAHATGAIQGNRIGSQVQFQGWTLTYDQLTSNTKLCTIKASTTEPVWIQARGVVQVAANCSGTATASLGTSAGGTQLLSAVDMKATAGTTYTPTNAVSILTADTDIYLVMATAGTTAATLGKIGVGIMMMGVNVNAPSTTGLDA